MYEGAVQDLIDELGRLPGIGPKSAQRIAFHVLQSDPEDVEGDPLGALGTDAGQPPELIDQVLNRALVHRASLRGSRRRRAGGVDRYVVDDRAPQDPLDQARPVELRRRRR